MGVRGLVVRVPVQLAAGWVREALLTDAADDSELFQVHVQVALQVRQQAEGLATLGAAVAFHLGVEL